VVEIKMSTSSLCKNQLFLINGNHEMNSKNLNRTLNQHKIKWQKTNTHDDFEKGEKITMVRWKSNNIALFLNKSKEEVEASFSKRLEIMTTIEFEINRAEFIGHETFLNVDGEGYNENPSAELALMNEKMMNGL